MQKLIKLSILQTIVCLLLSINLQAQTVSITPPALVGACSPNQFAMQYNGVSISSTFTIVATLSGVSTPSCSPTNELHLILDSIVTNGSSTSIVSVDNDSLLFTISSATNFTAYYSIQVDCHIVGTNSVSLVQSFYSTTGAVSVSNGFSNTFTTTSINRPELVLRNSSAFNFSYLKDTMLIFYYENTGDAGNIQFTFTPDANSYCNNLILDDTIYFQRGINAITPSVYNPIGSNTITLNPTDTLLIIQKATLQSCITSGCQTALISFRWQCDYNGASNNFCTLCQAASSTLNQYQYQVIQNDILNAEFQRLSPPSSAVELTCFNDTANAQTWTYKIYNTGNTVIDTLSYRLSHPLTNGNSSDLRVLSLIPESSVGYTLSPGSSCSVNLTNTQRTTWLCNDIVPDALLNSVVTIKSLGFADTVVFTFKTVRCGSEDTLILNQPKFYNRWNFGIIQAEGICTNSQTITTSSGFFGGTTISGQSSASTYDIDLGLDYFPTKSSLRVDNTGVSDTATLFIDFKGMLPKSPYSHQIVGAVTQNEHDTVKGWLRADIFIEEGLKIDNPLTDVAIVRYHPTDTLYVYPFTFYKDTILSTAGCHAGNYFFYFNMQDSGMVNAIDSGKFMFKFLGCCPSAVTPSPYSVTFTLLSNPDACYTLTPSVNDITPPVINYSKGNDAWLALSRRQKAMNILCPGCLSPGAISKSYRLERRSFGLQDTDNDGLADNPQTVITSNSPWFTQYGNSLRRNFSSYSDVIEDKMEINFVNGDAAGGYTYEQMTALGLRFNVMQLSRKIPHGLTTMQAIPDSVFLYVDTVYNGTACIDCNTFGYTPTSFSTQLSFVIGGNDIFTSGLLDTNTTGNEYRFYFDTYFNGSYTGLMHNPAYATEHITGLSFTGYYPNQRYRLRVVYRLCGNFSSEANSIETNVLESDVLNRMFFSGVRKEQDSDNLFQQVNTLDSLHSLGLTVDTNEVPQFSLIDTAYLNNHMFFCEAATGTHYFVSSNASTGGTINNLAGCEKRIDVKTNINTAFGKTLVDAFPFEYKPPILSPDVIKVALPQGYRVVRAGIQSKSTASSNLIDVTPNITYSITQDTAFIVYSSLPVFNCLAENNSPLGNDSLFAGDQETISTISLFILPIDCDDIVANYPAEITTATYGSSSICPTTTIACSNIAFADTSKLNPALTIGVNPNLTLTVTQQLQMSRDTLCWNDLEIKNPSVNPTTDAQQADHLFLDLPLVPYLSQWQFITGSNTFTANATTGYMQIANSLAETATISGRLCAVVDSCPPATDTIVFTLSYGWSCDSIIPTLYHIDSVCGIASVQLSFLRSDVSLSTEGKSVIPNQFTLCDTITVYAPFESGQLGMVYPDSVVLANLSPHLTLLNAYISDSLPNAPTAGLTYTATTGVFTIHPDSLNTIGYNTGGFNNGNDLYVYFQFIAGCGLVDNMIFPDITLYAHDYCGEQYNPSALFNTSIVSWDSTSICDDCFTVTKTANTDSLAAVSDTVTYTITVCNYSDTTYSFTVADNLPPSFIPSPFTSQTLTLASSQCDSILISGTFSQMANCPANMNVAIVTNQNTNTVQQDSVCVTVTDPCQPTGTLQIANNRTSRSLQFSSYSNTNFYVQGTFIVDSTFTIYRCTMYVAPGGQIVVQSSGGLTGNFIVNESVIQGCFQMWRGINVLGGSILEVDGQYVERRSIIADADTAIYAYNNTRVTIFNSNVINNIIGVYMPRHASAWNSITLIVEGSRFGLYANQLKPYFNATIIPSIPVAGIFLNDWNGIIGATSPLSNQFYNMQNGIQGYRSVFTSRQNYFERIWPDPNPDLAICYAAVVSIGQPSVRSGNVTVEAVAGGTPTMLNCFRGAYVNKSHLDIQSVNMDRMKLGITATQNNNMQTANISFNIIKANFIGIQLSLNTGSNVIVEGNNISIDTVGANNANICGIYAMEGSPNNAAGHYIAYNSITGSGEFRNGIFLQNVKDPVVIHNNPIRFTSNKTSNGINITNCKDGYFSCNHVDANYPHGTAFQTRGVHSIMGSGNNISCNGVDSTLFGFLFDDVQLATNFQGNTMQKHFEGLRLTKPAVIDTQSLAGNQWLYAALNGGFQAHNLNDSTLFNLQQSLFETDFSSNPIYTPTRPANNTLWFLNKSGTSYDCGNNPFCIAAARQSESNEGLLEKIAKNYTITSDYQDEAKLRGKEYLYEKLETDPQLLASDVDFQNFKTANDNLAIGKLYDAKTNLSQVTDYDSTYKAAVNSNYALIKLKQDSINLMDSIERISPQPNYFLLRDNLLTEITIYENNISNLKYQWDAIASAKINLAEAKNNSVTATQIQQSNEKFVFTVTIDYERSGISAIENNFSGLTFIAEQCPNVGGSAVFKARALLDLITDPRFYDDENTCVQYGYRKAQQNAALVKELNKIIVYPNPSSGIISIEINGISNSLLNVQVQDNEGRVLKTLRIKYKFEPIKIDVSDITSGFYVLYVISDTGFENRKKLLIVK